MVFFFNDTATTEIYTLSLHDALPIFGRAARQHGGLDPQLASGTEHLLPGRRGQLAAPVQNFRHGAGGQDRKSTRLNSSHANISYAVFCLKKQQNRTIRDRSCVPLADT